MNILTRIFLDKKKEVNFKKKAIPFSRLETLEVFQDKPRSFKKAIAENTLGLITEHKRRSPSESNINQNLSLTDVVRGYQSAKVAGLSILTESKYFGGSLDDMILARSATKMPILRKDFIFDEYQILEAKVFGADIILLIVAMLSEDKIKSLSKYAKSIGLEVLAEIHNLDELKKATIPSVDIIGVNNRNLKTFEVSIEVSKSIARYIPSEFLKISESGINTPEQIKELLLYNFDGFLIGESFMKTDNPGKAVRTLCRKI